MTTRTRGFTLVDLLVAIVCVAILIAIPACMTERIERANRMAQMVACQANLRGIGMAIAMFKAKDKDSRFPLLFETGQPEADIKATHSAVSVAALKSKLVGNEAAMQNVWVLIEKGLVTEDVFHCPADRDYAAREFEDRADRKARRVGWWSSRQFSYGMHFPYKSTMVEGGAIDNPAHIGHQLKGSFVIMADKNPSQNNKPAAGVSAADPSANHGDMGFGYLMFSGSVNWKSGQVDSQINGDDIYTIETRDNTNPATPADKSDQYIVRHPAMPEMPAK